MITIELLTKQLEESQTECIRLRKENERLQQKLATQDEKPAIRRTTEKNVKPDQHHSASISIHSPVENKIELFRNLFRGREDVYPVLWQAKDGRKGYSPACKNEWNKAYCNKKKVKMWPVQKSKSYSCIKPNNF